MATTYDPFAGMYGAALQGTRNANDAFFGNAYPQTQPMQQYAPMPNMPMFQPQGTDWGALMQLLIRTQKPQTAAQFNISGQQIDPMAERNPWKNGFFNKMGSDANPYSWKATPGTQGIPDAANQQAYYNYYLNRMTTPDRSVEPGLPSVPQGTFVSGNNTPFGNYIPSNAVTNRSPFTTNPYAIMGGLYR